jgi:oligopeptide transport system substrate-binding protein
MITTLFTLIAGLIFSLTPVHADIHIQIGGEPSTLEPAMAFDQYSLGILRNVVAGLFQLDPEGKLKNGLIDSYQVSKDQLTYTFKLKKASWSDGRPVTPDDFVFAFQRLLDPNQASPNAEFFFRIKNANDIFTKKMPVEQLGVTAKGKDLVIVLSEPDPSFPLELSLPAAAPLRRDLFESNKGKWKFDFAVTGDYTVTKYIPDDIIELTPNPQRAAKDQQKIVYHILTEDTTALNLLEAGKMDIITTVPFSEIERLRTAGLIQTVPSTTVFYLSFNHSREPFNDVNARRAIYEAIDTTTRQDLEKILKQTYAPIESYIPNSLDGYFVSPPHYSKKTITPPATLQNKRVKLSFGASSFTKLVTEKLQNDLKLKLGIQLELEPMELKMLLGRLRADPPDMYLLGMSAIYNDPLNQLKAFGTYSGPNFSRYQNSEFETLLGKVRTQPAGKKRAQFAREANKLLVQKDFALLPLVLRTQVLGVSKKIKGFHLSPYQVIALSLLQKN